MKEDLSSRAKSGTPEILGGWNKKAGRMENREEKSPNAPFGPRIPGSLWI